MSWLARMRVRQAWTEAGREGEPRILALGYFSIGDDVEEASYGYLRHYYGFLGDYAEMIAGGAMRGADAIRGALKAYEDAGVDELILDEFRSIMALPEPTVGERWIGTYASAPDRLMLVDRPLAGVRLVTITSGTGASTSFAIAEEVINDMLAEN